MYIPAGSTGWWQGTIRNQDDPALPELLRALAADQAFTIELLYGDQEGTQRFITRMTIPRLEPGDWSVNVTQHWPV